MRHALALSALSCTGEKEVVVQKQETTRAPRLRKKKGKIEKNGKKKKRDPFPWRNYIFVRCGASADDLGKGPIPIPTSSASILASLCPVSLSKVQ